MIKKRSQFYHEMIDGDSLLLFIDCVLFGLSFCETIMQFLPVFHLLYSLGIAFAGYGFLDVAITKLFELQLYSKVISMAGFNFHSR